MNNVANHIRQRLSLRKPQADSLELLAALAEVLPLKKSADLAAEAGSVKQLAQNESLKPELRAELRRFREFERDFPNICFSLATGVGKTRLMGAFIAYLYIAKGIRNFMLLAPNLTVYNKLVEDFGNPAHSKYVFKGIAEFANMPPLIVTGDNYNKHQRKQGSLYNDATINIFNIGKINTGAKDGNEPLVKRLSEYIGESYFGYLSGLADLVLLMDESHHYRATRGMEVINELNPVLGIEVTATPQVERGGRAVAFKNVVYEYSLAKAMNDGFVKEPAVATRRNFDAANFGQDELDHIKLEDGIYFHERTKSELELFARNNNMPLVKPFVLVVARDTNHANEIEEFIGSRTFFGGNYAHKVMQIHSKQSGSEKDENVARLLALENHDNNIEIVIHVNMLKEGWDVTNLYTIIPLRTAASLTLREQTIGRGLRLPYGKRVHNNYVDRLTIIAHDKFDELIRAANEAGSIIRRENIIEIDDQELRQRVEVVVSRPVADKVSAQVHELAVARQSAGSAMPEKLLEKEEITAAVNTVYDFGKTRPLLEVNLDELKTAVIERKREQMSSGQVNIFAAQELQEFAEKVNNTITAETLVAVQKNIIEIPRVMIRPDLTTIVAGFRDCDIDCSSMNFPPVSEEIVRKSLQTPGHDDIITGSGKVVRDVPKNIIVNELINIPEVDYDRDSRLLFKWAGQVWQYLLGRYSEREAARIIQFNKTTIARIIEAQIRDVFFMETGGFEKTEIHPFQRIREHNYSKTKDDRLYLYSETIEPKSSIPSKIFTGFKKACHEQYKFDSNPEKEFSAVLESSASVEKWLRPASGQIDIYWNHRGNKYEPDFIVGSINAIFMVEVKADNEITSDEVQAKKRAALEFCAAVNEYNASRGQKPWRYLLVPQSGVKQSYDFDYFAVKYCCS